MPTPNPKTRTTRSNSHTNISLDEIKQLIETSIVNTLRKEMESSNKIIEALLERVEKLERCNELLEQNYRKLSESRTSVDAGHDHMMQIISAEVQDMEFRKKNVMIFGLPEKSDGNIEERRRHDEESCLEIFSEINVTGAEIMSTHRFGKGRNDGKRPLKVVLQKSSKKREILTNAKHLRTSLFSRVYIQHDLTPLQQEKAKRLRSELKCRREKGENVVIYRGSVVSKELVGNFL